jgi:ribosomal subunit interface protein
MTEPQITYRGMPHSPAMDARIRELCGKLEDLHPKITLCHVVVGEMDRHKQKGNLFEVHLDIHVPGHEIVATRQQHEDAYAALNFAFDVLTRQLEEGLRKQRKGRRHTASDEPENPPPS